MICVLNKVVVMVCPGDAYEYEYKIDAYGNESGEPISKEKSSSQHRTYLCRTCGYVCNGASLFTMRDHLGKMNPVVDPFAVK